MKYLFFGLSITSTWGNEYATTYRGLLRALAARGHLCTFFEQRTAADPAHRDQDPAEADYVKIEPYDSWEDRATQARASRALTFNEVVVIGSDCPAGAAIADYVLQRRRAYNRILYYVLDLPGTLERLAADGVTPTLRGDQLARFDGVLASTGGSALDELRDRWGVARPLALTGGVDPPASDAARAAALDAYIATL